MQSLRSLIASPSALFAFEAAGRHMSFTRAADELNVSQAAVSYSIKQLESALGQPLFIRRHRRIELTEAGERFFHDVSIGLAHIRRSADALQRERSEHHVTLSVSTAFASGWMLPRLSAFRADHPDIDLRLQTTDKDVDLAAEGISLGIRRGTGDWQAYESALLAREEIRPVCSPSYLATVPKPSRPSDLVGLRLIHLDEPFRPAPTWADWFAAQGIDFSDKGDGMRLNDYAMVIQAALEGGGVALGWRYLTDDYVARRLLTYPIAHNLRTSFGFYVVWPHGAQLSADAVATRDWLCRQASQ
jgi:DNA-binding transcriptional LysR family regulator